MKRFHTRRLRAGFTLIELMVVVAIIAVLVSLLVPLMSRVKRQAKITECASNLRQICQAMTTYATDNDGQYPTLGIPQGTGGNLWDTSPVFYNVLTQQGLTYNCFFCPAAQDYAMSDAGFNRSYYYIIGYNIWVPRLNGADIIPPAPTYSGSRFQIVSPPPTVPFAGPAKMSDAVAETNPIVADVAGSNGPSPPANADATLSGNPWGFSGVTEHREGNRLLGVNQVFADGHVELHPASDLKPYYGVGGGWWNWR